MTESSVKRKPPCIQKNLSRVRCIQPLLSLPGRGHDYDLLTWTTVPESTSAGYNTRPSLYLRVKESPLHHWHTASLDRWFLTIAETIGPRSLGCCGSTSSMVVSPSTRLEPLISRSRHSPD